MPAQPDYQPEIFAPTKGLNSQAPDISLDSGEVSNDNNWLFEDEEAYTRPGLHNYSPSGFVSGKSLSWIEGLENQVSGVLAVDNSGNIYIVNSALTAATQLTGPASSFQISSGIFPTKVLVNGAILIGSDSLGLLHINFGASAYTRITSVAPRFVTAINSQALGAYDSLVAAPLGGLKVMWSAFGDETTWTGSTNGSGSTLLLDAGGDIITGTCVLHNVWVILRNSGIHLGYVTGIAFPAFRFENWSRGLGSIGCSLPSTLATRNNVAYFMSGDSVYKFDLNSLTPISAQIRTQLQSLILAGNVPVGFCTSHIGGSTPRPRGRYHLFFPQGGPHFVYNIDEDNWAQCSYSQSMNWGCHFDAPTVSSQLVGVLLTNGSTTPGLQLWDSGINCETTSSFQSKRFVLGTPDKDYTIRRILVAMRDFGSGNPITVQLLVRPPGGSGPSKIAAPSANLNDGFYGRTWFDVQDTGNLAAVKVSTAAGVKASIALMLLDYGSEGVFRG